MYNNPTDFITFNEIEEEVHVKYVPLAPDLIGLLNPDRDLALKTFEKLIEDSVRQFYWHYPVVIEKDMRSKGSMLTGEYDFIDNFDDYLDGLITEDQIELVPFAIAKITTGWANVLTKNNWDYRRPHLRVNGGASIIKYFAYPPVKCRISPDGRFTEDSKVYYVHPENQEELIEQVALEVLKYLQRTRNSVQQGTNLNFFDFTYTIQELEQEMMDFYSVSPNIYAMY